MKKLLIICGPTATGKTSLAQELAKQFNGELISADSRQVYKGMNIGTGKDYPTDGSRIWLYDEVNPDEQFSVGHYQRLAKGAIEDIREKGKLPILVGGTGLYIKSLIVPMETISAPPNKKWRDQSSDLSLEDLQKRLEAVSPGVWSKMNESDRQNPRRLIRKIELAKSDNPASPARHCLAGVQGSALQNLQEVNVLSIGLTAPYPFLYERIDQRVEERVQQGIIDEIKGLLAQGYSWNLPAMNTLGYKEWKPFFSISNTHPPAGGPIPNDERTVLKNHIIQRWKFDEHAYARRQMTWFRKMKNIEWFDITGAGYKKEVEDTVQRWYTT